MIGPGVRETMRQDETPDPELTLDELTNRFPETIEIFNRFGMDVCCGGGATLREAAERDGVNLASIQAALRDALANRAVRGRA